MNGNVCSKCKREIEHKLENDKWIAYDKFLGKRHGQVCYKGPPPFKENDYIIAFWLKSTTWYKINQINQLRLDFHVFERDSLKQEDSKRIDFVSAVKHCKLMDNIFRLLYL